MAELLYSSAQPGIKSRFDIVTKVEVFLELGDDPANFFNP
jgi:hypothetical protein